MAAKVRVARMRERQKEQRRHAEVARNYETAGDIATQRFAYIEAMDQYEKALAVSRSPEDEVRLCDKIGDALQRGARPDLATPWFERMVAICMRTDSLRAKIPQVLAFLPHPRWLESRTPEALEASLRAKSAATEYGDKSIIQNSHISITGWLLRLGSYAEAERILMDPQRGNILDQEPVKSQVRAYELTYRAIIWATHGQASMAFTEFNRALDVSKKLPDGYVTTTIWDDYANWATALGRLDIARGCRERALLVARERRITWRIPYLTLRFAYMLVTAGDYDHARDLVHDTLTYDTATPVIRVLLSTVGVEVARILNDDVLLKRTLDDEALELAFQSQEPERIASIVAAYAKISIARGQFRRVRRLIARGMQFVHHADHAGNLLALAARHGMPADASRAREVLLERTQLPYHRVAEAYLALWEAGAAQRRRAHSEVSIHAENAAQQFKRLGWKYQQSEALAFIRNKQYISKSSDSLQKAPILGDLSPILSTREQQVAELVLRGLTNRAIAQVLSISENTVETHMTSILNRLGLRSRWQLVDLAP